MIPIFPHSILQFLTSMLQVCMFINVICDNNFKTMPPKPKLHKNKGKSELKISSTANTPTEGPSNDLANNQELQEQFETELCWCIQQLQRSLNSGKLNQKEVKDNTKVLNMLMNNSTPFIKKRQLMRLTFGDYRSKMFEENKKISKAMTLNIKTAPPSKKSVFVKKSLFSSSGSNFKFDFHVENTDDDLSADVGKIGIGEEAESDKSTENYHFATSDNAFRFNFDVDGS